MFVGISDRYLDIFYRHLVNHFDYVEYQIYHKDDLKILEQVDKECFVHLPDPVSEDFMFIVEEVSKNKNV